MESINSVIDHTYLKPDARKEDIIRLCEEANEYNFFAVCVPPIYVELAKKHAKQNVKVCTVVGFPLGNEHMISKVTTTKKAIEEGADEIDMVINISAVKNGDWDAVKSEIDKLTTITKLKSGKVFKVILEICYLNKEEIIRLCEICNECEVDFVKTSTGFGTSGADIDTVKLMRSLLDKKIKIKASGGINSYKNAIKFINAGAERIGASKSLTIMSKS